MNGSEGSFARAIRGPVTLITVGVLFALNNFTPYRFHKTWPVLLIVFGLLSLLRRSERVPSTGPQTFPPYQYPPPDTGSFRQSTYTATSPPAAPPPEAAKGGFGSSAAPRANSEQPPSGEV